MMSEAIPIVSTLLHVLEYGTSKCMHVCVCMYVLKKGRSRLQISIANYPAVNRCSGGRQLAIDSQERVVVPMLEHVFLLGTNCLCILPLSLF